VRLSDRTLLINASNEKKEKRERKSEITAFFALARTGKRIEGKSLPSILVMNPPMNSSAGGKKKERKGKEEKEKREKGKAHS